MATSMDDGVMEAVEVCLMMLREENQDAPDDYRLALETLVKILRNILSNPTEEKYKKLKTENKTFHRKVWRHAGGQQLLSAIGWVEVEDVVVLTDDSHLHAAVGALESALSQLPKSSAPSPPSQQNGHTTQTTHTKTAKDTLIDQEKQKRIEAQKRLVEEKKRIKEQMAADRRETSNRETKSSKATDMSFGGDMKKFADIGIDLNKGGG